MTGRELMATVKARKAQLDAENPDLAKRGHVRPCGYAFDYQAVTRGDPKGLEMVLREVSERDRGSGRGNAGDDGGLFLGHRLN